MVEMNPFYARPSKVGDVFDVAAWSPRKALTTAIFGAVAGILFAAATFYACSPRYATSLVIEKHVPQLLREANDDLLRTHKKHPWAARATIGVLGFLSVVCIIGAISFLMDFLSGDFYFRAGPGGLSLRIPGQTTWSKFNAAASVQQLDLSWQAIRDWTIVQKKELGSLSPNAGNLNAYMKVTMVDGSKFFISLDMFREPARIIYNRIQDAMEMTAAKFDGESEQLDDELIGAGAD